MKTIKMAIEGRQTTMLDIQQNGRGVLVLRDGQGFAWVMLAGQ
jgi:hypothetical protein